MVASQYFTKVASIVAGVSLITGAAPAFAIDATPKQPIAAVQPAAEQTSEAPRRGNVLGGIFGCQADGEKQIIGAAAGGALGGLLGNRIAGSGSRTLGTLIGGALGAVAGSALGCKLQKNDQAKAERAAQAALATGKSQTWQSDETGASGKVEVGQSAGSTLADLKLASKVEPAAAYTKVGKTYTATAPANIRSAPNTSASSLGQLKTGQLVYVPAAVNGAAWMLISSNGIGQGYVSAPLLKVATTSAAASGCKMVKQTVSTQGSADESETLQACKGADGQWVMTRV
jgi:surface antigen